MLLGCGENDQVPNAIGSLVWIGIVQFLRLESSLIAWGNQTDACQREREKAHESAYETNILNFSRLLNCLFSDCQKKKVKTSALFVYPSLQSG